MRIEIYITILMLLVSNTSKSQESNYENYYVCGYEVNVRKDTSLTSKPKYQVNWGDKYTGIEKGNWIKIMSLDEDGFYFIHKNYITTKNDFLDKARKLKDKNSKTNLLLIENDLASNNNENEAIEKAISLINKDYETIWTGFESCELVNNVAYQIIRKYKKSEQFEILENKVISPIIKNLIELNRIEILTKSNKYEEAIKQLNNLIKNSSDYLTLPIECEYDLDSKVYPQIKVKNLYFINYHLSENSTKLEIIRNLRSICNKDESLKSTQIAKDIYNKLNEVWNID